MDRILIVDDERGVRESLQAVLADEGFEVDAVATGEECLELLDQKDYGAVLLDVWLPRMDGLEVLKSIGLGPGHPRVIMISGHGSIETAVRATKLGAFDFLEKPLSLEKILLVVRNALTQRKLQEQNRRLRRQVLGEPRLIGDSKATRRLRREIARLAGGTGVVLIRGESGSGKEVAARAIHAGSRRVEEPFVEVHCAGIPEDRFHAELFGAARGAEPEPGEAQRGKIDLADGGSLYLDDVGNVPAAAQPQLLRLLDEGTFMAVGSAEALRVDIRVMAATRVDLEGEIRDERLSPDLASRLQETTLRVPPLRERPEDIAPMALHFLEEFRGMYGRGPFDFEDPVLDALRAYGWPGNVRELRNLVERLVITVTKQQVVREDLPPMLGGASTDEDPLSAGRTLREGREVFERQFILRRLAENGHNITRTAEALGVERSHLHRKIKALALS